MEILDVACGDAPYSHATVCGDLFVCPTKHRNLAEKLESRSLPNFVKFDATHLPFKDSSFDLIHARMILEHLQNPLEALRDWARVSRKLILIVPENKDEILQCNPMHLYSWSRFSLEHLLHLVYKQVQVRQVPDTLKWHKHGKLPDLCNFLLTRFFNRLTWFNHDALLGFAENRRGNDV